MYKVVMKQAKIPYSCIVNFSFFPSSRFFVLSFENMALTEVSGINNFLDFKKFSQHDDVEEEINVGNIINCTELAMPPFGDVSLAPLVLQNFKISIFAKSFPCQILISNFPD